MESEAYHIDSEANGESLDLDGWLEVLQQVKTPEEAQRIRQSSTERELWKRGALVRYFDEQLFVEVLTADLPNDFPATQFQRFITRSGVEAVPRTQNLYRLKDAVRAEYLAAWREGLPTRANILPEAQIAFYRRLAAFYEKEQPVSQLDLLGCLLSFDQERARRLLLHMYEAAYANFDLPTCYTLLKMLDEQSARLTPALEQLRVQYRQFYNARSIFATEYYQSAVYFTRAQVRDAFTVFLAQQPHWIFQLYATGGMGKTIFLRWLIARYCIPAPTNIPVARLDFDFLPLATIEKHPWLLLQPLAVQLNEQLEGRPFYRLADSPTGLREFAPLLREPKSKEQQAEQEIANSKLGTSEAYWRQSAIDDFRNILAQRNLTKPVLIMLDTLEVMVLTRPATLLTILDYFASIRQRCPQLRLVLAGRYNLRERVPGFSDRYQNQATSVELAKFTEDEAVEYLREKRHLADHLPLTAIAKRSEGIPFKLSLFADLASARESLTEAEVWQFPRADFAYLIERIIERVREDEVRWVLRYGVLPRRLTRSFLDNVMRKPLEAERAQARRDDPKKLPDELAWNEEYQKKDLWRHQRELLNLDQVWDQLRSYASGYGWISYEDDSFKFQPDVRNPMRDLLQAQPIFAVLHKSAVRYFVQQARRHSAQWAEFTCEAVYHQFQWAGAAAGKYWREKLAEAETRQAPQAVKLLAADATGLDYVEEGKARLRADKRPIISFKDLCHAHRLAAESAIQLAFDPSRRKDEWGVAHAHLVQLRVLRPHRFTGLLPLLLQAAGAMQAEQNTEAVPLLEQCVKRIKPKALRLSLVWQQAELQAALSLDGAEQSYKTALRLAEANPTLLIPPATIQQALATWYDKQHQFAEAERAYQTMWASPAKRRHQLAVAFALARLYLRFGQFAKARKIARQATSVVKAPTDQFALNLLSAEFELACRRPLAGLAYLAKAESFQTAASGAGVAAARELRGVLLGQLLEFAPALEALEAASHQWGELGDHEGQHRCRLHLAEIQLYGVGNLKEARDYLEKWRRAARESTFVFESETRLRLELLYVEVLTRLGPATIDGGAQDHWQMVAKFAWVNQVPQWCALTLATGIALGYATPEQMTEWVDALQQIQPASAQLSALEPLRLMETPPKLLPPALRAALRALLGAASTHALASKDAVAHVIIAADLYRLLGEPAPPFWASVARRREQWSTFGCRELRQATDRWHRQFGEDPLADAVVTSEEAMQQYPMWDMANAMEQAERCFQQGRYDECEALVNVYKDRFNTSFPAHWYPRCRTLIGKLHIVKFRQGGGEEELQQADAAFSNAQHLYSVLYDSLADERIGREREQLLASSASLRTDVLSFAAPKEVSPFGESAITPANVEPPAYTVWFQFRQQARLGSDLLRGKGNQAALVVESKAADNFPERQELFESLAQMARYELVNWLVTRTPHALGTVLLTRQEADAVRHGSYREEDLQLNLAPGSLAALPWELGRMPAGEPEFVGQFFHSLSRTTPQASASRETIEWAQRASRILTQQNITIDGLFGPQTRATLAKLQTQFSLAATDGYLNRATLAALVEALQAQPRPPMRVAALQLEETRYAQGGLQFLGHPTSYEQEFEIRTLYDPTWETLQELKAQGPQVIYLSTTMEESSRDGEIAIRLGRQDYVTASRLTQFLKELQTRPVIILDLPRPYDAHEGWRQSLLRNQFVTELFHWENTGSIFATGLLERDVHERWMYSLLAGLARGHGFGELVSAREVLPYVADASQEIGRPLLWTLDPGLSLLPTGDD